MWLKLHLNFLSATENIFNLKYSVTVIEHMYKQNKNILMTQPSNVPSLEVYNFYSLAASEPNKPRNCLWSADVNINASLHLVILFKSMCSRKVYSAYCDTCQLCSSLMCSSNAITHWYNLKLKILVRDKHLLISHEHLWWRKV